MGKVKFIEDHPAGIKKGTEVETDTQSAQRWVNQGLATCKDMKVDHNAKKDRDALKKAYTPNERVADLEEEKD